MKTILYRNRVVFITSILIYLVSFTIGIFYQDFISLFSSNKHIELEYKNLVMNNLNSIFTIISGFFSFGFISIFWLIANGMIVGMVVSSALMNNISWYEVGLTILPHGILEIPALIIAGAVGFKSSDWLITKMLGTPRRNVIKDSMILIMVSVLCILIAGFIEANITPIVTKT
ncbi:stage II sporulation protein M [Bacillus toyonensis]|uniref:stage II sporulation protein M n=1 Tax=Bacillus toyonensis TaxID=155322 RepID=UPI003D64CE29